MYTENVLIVKIRCKKNGHHFSSTRLSSALVEDLYTEKKDKDSEGAAVVWFMWNYLWFFFNIPLSSSGWKNLKTSRYSKATLLLHGFSYLIDHYTALVT